MPYFIYIMTDRPKGTMYVGFTSDLRKRVYEQRTEAVDGFTKRYSLKWLVHYEMGDDHDAMLQREKRLKEWNRIWKFRLIEEKNPAWRDLWEDIID